MPKLNDHDAMTKATQEAFLNWWAAATDQADGPAAATAVIRTVATSREAVEALMGYSIGPFQAGVLFALSVVQDRANYPSGVGDD